MFGKKSGKQTIGKTSPSAALEQRLADTELSPGERATLAGDFITNADIDAEEMTKSAESLKHWLTPDIVSTVEGWGSIPFTDVAILYHFSNRSMYLNRLEESDRWTTWHKANRHKECASALLQIFGVRSPSIAEILIAFAVHHDHVWPRDRYDLYMQVLPATEREATPDELRMLRDAFAKNLGGGSSLLGQTLPAFLDLEQRLRSFG